MSPEGPANVLRPTASEAFAAYTALVVANREQVERLRDEPEASSDFWAPRAARFRPGILDIEEMPGLLALAQPEDTWLDVGAGGGRFALPLSGHVGRVVAVEPSEAMRGVLADAIATAGRTNLEVRDNRWPLEADAGIPTADVSLVANVLYDSQELEAFIAALEAHTKRTCVVICSDRAPSTPDPGLWAALHGEPICALPGLPEFLAVLGALRRRFEVRAFGASPEATPLDLDAAVAESLPRYWVAAGSPKGRRLRELLVEHFGTPEGQVVLPPRRNYSAVISWAPPRG